MAEGESFLMQNTSEFSSQMTLRTELKLCEQIPICPPRKRDP